MAALNMPANPPTLIPMCRSASQQTCPTLGTPMWATGPTGIAGEPDRFGRIVKFEPVVSGEMGAWIETRDGLQWLYPLTSLTSLVVGSNP